MQIKSIVAAMTILACLLLESTAIAASGEQNMTTTRKPAATVKVRNTRPVADHHKDARACLDAKKNETIIKCANKYH